VSAFNDAASEMVYPLLPAFMVGTLGAPATALGALDGAADLTAALLRFVSGRLADNRLLRGPLILFGYLVATIARPLIGISQGATQVIGLRVADRFGKGLRSPARDAMLAESVPVSLRGRAFGLHRSFDHAGAVVGSLLAWLLLERGMAAGEVIRSSLIPGLLAVGVLAWVLQRAGRESASTVAPALVVRTELASPFWPAIAMLTLVMVARLPETLLLLHLQRAGVPTVMIPLAWAGLHVVRSAVAYPAGRVVDAIGERSVVSVSGVVAAIGAVLLSLGWSPGWQVAVFLAMGVVVGTAEPAERSLIARLAPKGLGRAYGEAQALFGVAALATGIGFGLLVDARGSEFALMVSAAASALAVVAWRSLGGRR
jgi:MFS family permease